MDEALEYGVPQNLETVVVQVQIIGEAVELGEGLRQNGEQVVSCVQHLQFRQSANFFRQGTQLIVRDDQHAQFFEVPDLGRDRSADLVSSQVERDEIDQSAGGKARGLES